MVRIILHYPKLMVSQAINVMTTPHKSEFVIQSNA